MTNLPSMVSKGKEPLFVFKVNGKYVLAVYQGSLSDFDLLLKYRQRVTNTKSGWSRIRTPKHIHWAVDMIIKMHSEPEQTKKFIEALIVHWDNTKPLQTKQEQHNLLNEKLLKEVSNEASKYKQLATKGEYSLKFLLLIAKLLMVQEKTNFHSAYMFKDLLYALLRGEDIFKIISIATHR